MTQGKRWVLISNLELVARAQAHARLFWKNRSDIFSADTGNKKRRVLETNTSTEAVTLRKVRLLRMHRYPSLLLAVVSLRMLHFSHNASLRAVETEEARKTKS